MAIHKPTPAPGFGGFQAQAKLTGLSVLTAFQPAFRHVLNAKCNQGCIALTKSQVGVGRLILVKLELGRKMKHIQTISKYSFVFYVSIHNIF